MLSLFRFHGWHCLRFSQPRIAGRYFCIVFVVPHILRRWYLSGSQMFCNTFHCSWCRFAFVFRLWSCFSLFRIDASVTSSQLCDSCHEVLAQPPRQRLRFSGGLLAVLHVDSVAQWAVCWSLDGCVVCDFSILRLYVSCGTEVSHVMNSDSNETIATTHHSTLRLDNIQERQQICNTRTEKTHLCSRSSRLSFGHSCCVKCLAFLPVLE